MCLIPTSLVMALQRFSSPGKRIYYSDGGYMVSVRYPGQWHDIRDFVQPHNPDVVAVYRQIGPAPWDLYDFVCRRIDYRLDFGEFWAFPSEVLARGEADCPYIYFNDADVIELWQGALAELFGIGRDEATKLSLMGRMR